MAGNGNGNGNGKGKSKGNAKGNDKGKRKGSGKGNTVDVVVAGKTVYEAVLDAAAPYNIMPIHTMEVLGLKPTWPTTNLPYVPTDIDMGSTSLGGLNSLDESKHNQSGMKMLVEPTNYKRSPLLKKEQQH